MTQTTDADRAKARAEASFKRQQMLDGAAEAREAAAADQAAVAAKTERLRALRLAKEQSDQIARDVRKARRER